MPLWKPNGTLNISAEPADLGDGDMSRCKNMRLNQVGKLVTRKGSQRVNGKEDRNVPASSSDFVYTHGWESIYISGAGVRLGTYDSNTDREWQYLFAWEVPAWGGNDNPWAYRAMHAHEQMGLEETDFWLLHTRAGVRYSFVGDQIFKNETSIDSGNTSAQWSALNYNQFNDTTQQVYAVNGTDRKRIEDDTVYEWGIEAPTAAPEIEAGGAAGLTGAYNVKYTYAKKVGTAVVSESNPSPEATASVTLSDQSLDITWTASSDAQVTHVRIYRTRSGGATYNHVVDIPIGTTTTDDNTADTLLGNAVETDHNRPPAGTVVAGPSLNGTCLMINGNQLHFCLPKQPEYWPTNYFIEVASKDLPGVALEFWNGQPYWMNTEEIYYIQGSGQGTFFPLPMRARTGAQGINGSVAVSGRGIYHTGPDGVYLFTGSNSDRKVSLELFDPIFQGESVQGVPAVNDMATAILHEHEGNLYFAYADADDDFPANLIVVNIDNLRTAYYRYNDGSYDLEIRSMANDDTNDRLLIGDDAGFVRILEIGTKDSVQDIAWEAQSKDFTLQTRAHFPRWNKYDVDASSATSATGAIVLDGEVIQEHTLTSDRDTRRRNIDEQDNGERLAFRVSGTGPVTVYAVEGE